VGKGVQGGAEAEIRRRGKWGMARGRSSWGGERISTKNGDFAPTGAGCPKISGGKASPPPTILLLTKLG